MLITLLDWGTPSPEQYGDCDMSRWLAMVFLTTFAACLGGCEALQQQAEKADALAEETLNLIASNSSDRLYNEFIDDDLRDHMPREQWKQLISDYSARMGDVQTVKRTRLEVKSRAGVTTGQYEYAVQWAKGSGTFILTTKYDGEFWKILDIKITTDALGKN